MTGQVRPEHFVTNWQIREPAGVCLSPNVGLCTFRRDVAHYATRRRRVRQSRSRLGHRVDVRHAARVEPRRRPRQATAVLLIARSAYPGRDGGATVSSRSMASIVFVMSFTRG